MKDEEFNLSEKIFVADSDEVIHIIDVKEFIRRLKNEITHQFDWDKDINDLVVRAIIDELAGEKLIKKEK